MYRLKIKLKYVLFSSAAFVKQKTTQATYRLIQFVCFLNIKSLFNRIKDLTDIDMMARKKN